MNLTEDQILALAPDDASRKAGKELGGPAKWVSRGGNDAALWGECKGSGAKPYQAIVDLGTIAFKCTCPSRKFPCKHGLGLLLYGCKYPADFTENQQPAWVGEWLGKRAEKEVQKAEKAANPDKPVDEAAQEKRRQARNSKVNDGIEELLLWIKDIIRNGIIGVPEKGRAFWQNMGKRLVDAQAGTLAGMVNELGEINYFNDNWQTIFLDQLLQIYLVISAYKNLDVLPADMQQDVRTLVGFNQKVEELKGLPEVRDNWLVLGRQTDEEGQLTVERNWLYGTNTNKYALILNFYVRSQPREVSLSPGTTIDAGLVFYPSTFPQRAIVVQQYGIAHSGLVAGCKGWDEVFAAQSRYRSTDPFLGNQPFIIDNLRPVNNNEKWWLQDVAGNSIELKLPIDATWKLVAMSGGQFLPMSVVGKEYEYVPLGVWHNGQYKLF